MKAADVLAIDLPWSARKGRTAIATRTGRSVSVSAVANDDELVAFVVAHAARRALVLLDVPLEGCAALSRSCPNREVDRRLAAVGIPVLPSYSSGMRGPNLVARLHAKRRDLRCMEVYPYAVLRTLWALQLAGKAFRFAGPEVDLTAQWRAWPPRYKRERDLAARRRCVRHVAALLGSVPGMRAAVRTIARATHAQLDALCDEYDALLGLVAGIALVDSSPWSWLARTNADVAPRRAAERGSGRARSFAGRGPRDLAAVDRRASDAGIVALIADPSLRARFASYSPAKTRVLGTS